MVGCWESEWEHYPPANGSSISHLPREKHETIDSKVPAGNMLQVVSRRILEWLGWVVYISINFPAWIVEWSEWTPIQTTNKNVSIQKWFLAYPKKNSMGDPLFAHFTVISSQDRHVLQYHPNKFLPILPPWPLQQGALGRPQVIHKKRVQLTCIRWVCHPPQVTVTNEGLYTIGIP